MAAPSQRDVINDMQGRLIGQGKDIEYLKKQADSTDTKLGIVIDTISKLAYVPLADFEMFKRTNDDRIAALETYNNKNSLGVRFSNDIIGNILKLVALAAGAAILYATVKYLNSGGGH